MRQQADEDMEALGRDPGNKKPKQRLEMLSEIWHSCSRWRVGSALRMDLQQQLFHGEWLQKKLIFKAISLATCSGTWPSHCDAQTDFATPSCWPNCSGLWWSEQSCAHSGCSGIRANWRGEDGGRTYWTDDKLLKLLDDVNQFPQPRPVTRASYAQIYELFGRRGERTVCRQKSWLTYCRNDAARAAALERSGQPLW